MDTNCCLLGDGTVYYVMHGGVVAAVVVEGRDRHDSRNSHGFQEDVQVDDLLCGRPMNGENGVDKEACASMADVT